MDGAGTTMTASEAEARQKQYKRGRAEAFREAAEWCHDEANHAYKVGSEDESGLIFARDHFRKRAEEAEDENG